MKGVAQDVAEEVVDEEKDEVRALRADCKKALSLIRIPMLDHATFRTRLGSFLQWRGFNYQVSTRAIPTLWQELRDQEPSIDSS
jgi:regulatory protein